MLGLLIRAVNQILVNRYSIRWTNYQLWNINGKSTPVSDYHGGISVGCTGTTDYACNADSGAWKTTVSTMWVGACGKVKLCPFVGVFVLSVRGAGHASGADTQLLPRQLSQIIVGLCSHRLYTFDFSTSHNWQVFANWSTATVLSVMLFGNLCSCTAVMVERHQMTAAVTSDTYQYSHGMSRSNIFQFQLPQLSQNSITSF